MIKYFFTGTPFEFQIFSNAKPSWFISLNDYYDEDTYLNSIGIGKYTICWRLPPQKMIDKVIAENQAMGIDTSE
jgi:hypothetical protein